ncbi:acyltransferase family protein [Adhaeribacter terreus]|uniref:Acyltransferase family protein n=1 Tax=Adhaeribacter terreus TaxID=529703 RepID=A0ABW0E7G7_9BACT
MTTITANMIDPLNPLFALIIFLLAFLTGFAINRTLKPAVTSQLSRYESIDGLRGLLGISVFIHHASIWHQYLQTGTWTLTKSNLFNHFGQTSVALFFMISAFLFTSKLLHAQKGTFNWPDFFISRFLRLVPLYYAALAVIIIFVMVLSNWQLNGSFSEWLVSVFRLAAFEIPGETVLNKHPLANLINAKITWTLRFEWLFYFSLPLIALFILKKKPSGFYLLFGTVFILIFYKYHGLKHYADYLSFAGGILVAFLVRHFPIRSKTDNIFGSLVILVSFLAIPQFKTPDELFCKMLIILIFLLIAAGNDLFGLLRNATLKFLGHVCYSTYLLHGILIFSVVYFGIGIESARTLEPSRFSVLIFAITPVLIVLSYLGFRFIEKPAIDLAKKIRLNRSKISAKVTKPTELV